MIGLVDHMTESPAICVACGSNPPGDDGQPQKAIDLGVDVNWGDNAYLCMECVDLICQLVDRPSKTTVQRVIDQNKLVNRRNKQMAKELEEKDALLTKIREGSEAVKKAKKTETHAEKRAKEGKGGK